MASGHAEEHAEHHGVHLPDPSIWPFVVGTASLVLGLAILWWVRDDNAVAGPFLGAAATFTLISAAGWAYEDGRMKKKAEAGEVTSGRQARYTQVVTFAIAEGKLDAARSADGLLSELEHSDNELHNLAGFQDLRIILSPAVTGPTQVLVETTWSDREGLATYEETRKTLLDQINGHSDEVETGSTQVFDMEVLRDTKDVGFRMSTAALVSILSVFIVGGFMVGAGLNVFASDHAAATSGPVATAEPEAPNTASLIATDNKFSKGQIEGATAGTEFTVNFKNNGKAPHNLAFLTAKGGASLAPGASGAVINGGQSEALKFTVPNAGTYYFQCDLHPDQMSGQFVVT
jgi:plastocyanin/heme-degrading monooxygenase HmoA